MEKRMKREKLHCTQLKRDERELDWMKDIKSRTWGSKNSDKSKMLLGTPQLETARNRSMITSRCKCNAPFLWNDSHTHANPITFPMLNIDN